MTRKMMQGFLGVLLAVFFTISGALGQSAEVPPTWNMSNWKSVDMDSPDAPAALAKEALRVFIFRDPYELRPEIESWLEQMQWKDESQTIILLTLPNMKKAGTSGLTKYEGQEPIGYVYQLMAGIRRKVQEAPPAKTLEIPVENKDDILTAVGELLAQLDEYVVSTFKSMQAYKAFSRIAFPHNKVADFVTKIFATGSHAPSYKKEAERKVLSIGDKSNAIKYVQQMLMDKGYMENGKVTNEYTDVMAQAVAAFQADAELPVDGNTLSLEHQNELLNRQDTYEFLMESFIDEIGYGNITYRGDYLSEPEEILTLLSERYPLFLRTLSKVQWMHDSDGLYLSYTVLSPSNFEDEIIEDITAQYMNKKINKDGIEAAIIKQIQGLWTRKGVDLSEHYVNNEYVFPFENPLNMYQELASEFVDFNSDYEYLYNVLMEYAEENPQPLKAPSNGVIDKPSSGQSKIKFVNNSNDMAYVKIYTTDEDDYNNKGRYMGSMFIMNKKSVTVSLPAGTYTCTMGSGEYWFGFTDLFGPNGDYEVLEPSPYIPSNYMWTVTISPPEDSEGDYTDSDWIPMDAM